MKNSVTNVQHQNTKNKTVILICPRYSTYLLICFVFHFKNDDTMPNAATINKFLETTSCSELRKWFGNIYKKQ